MLRVQVLSYKEHFNSVIFGAPLLSTEQDKLSVIKAIADEFPDLGFNDALVLMGHGTSHKVNSVYTQLNKDFKSLGYPNFFLGTVEADPTIQDLVTEVQAFHPSKVILTPFMIVAGNHAHNDMAGTDPDSWLWQFRNAGNQVCPVLKGLGEYPGIRAVFIEHIQEAAVRLNI